DLLSLKEQIGATVVFVTHSVFESVFLSDRILVMAARPGRVISEIEVPEPYPRGLEWRTSKTYGEVARETSDQLNSALHPEGGLTA
ncbi:MAG: ABC transporter ATP-binding protein, partial [Pseudomonadota bacterium]